MYKKETGQVYFYVYHICSSSRSLHIRLSTHNCTCMGTWQTDVLHVLSLALFFGATNDWRRGRRGKDHKDVDSDNTNNGNGTMTITIIIIMIINIILKCLTKRKIASYRIIKKYATKIQFFLDREI